MRERPVRVRPAPDAARPAGVDPILAQLYAARGVADAAGLDYGLGRLAPVSTLNGIADGVDLLLRHRGRKIVVVGDFDADGATSTALVIRCLRAFGGFDADYLVPDRFRFGYGLTPEIVGVAGALDPALLITVDNGVSSIDGVAEARRRGIQVLVTDHHLPGPELPAADVMINPNLADSTFRSPNLAGVGVAFYLMAALGRELEAAGEKGAAKVPARYLDLVALGTVADVVRLDHNNRILVSQGLARIRAGVAVAGIRALFEQAGRSVGRAVSSDLGFAAGPRLNAAGRLEDMAVGIECLLSDDPQEAAGLAARLDAINSERRSIETRMRKEAFDIVDAMPLQRIPACVCLYDSGWHQGVVGLIASRVRERCDRPVIAFARDGDATLKGSARSVSGVHARDLLEAVASAEPGLVTRFGGHAMAAGLTLPESGFERFAELASEKLMALYPEADFSGTIVTDGRLPDDRLTLDFARTLREAGPWGAGFPEPVFSGDFRVEAQRTVGGNHLKMQVRPAAGGRSLDAIAFSQAGADCRGVVRLVYRLDVNEFRGVESPQLIVEQIVNLHDRA